MNTIINSRQNAAPPDQIHSTNNFSTCHQAWKNSRGKKSPYLYLCQYTFFFFKYPEFQCSVYSVPRVTTENSQDGLEMQTCEKHLHRSDTENIPAGPSAEIPPRENESKNEKVLILQSCTEQIKNNCSDTPRGIKEKIEATIKQEPTETATEFFLNVACDIEVKTEVEWIGAESVSWVDLVDATDQRARPGKSFDAAKSGEEMSSEEKYQTAQHFTLKQEPSSEDLLTLPRIKKEKNNADNAVGTGLCHKTLIHRGV